MSELIIIQPETLERYKMISLTATEDPNLSWEAKGLHTYLISRPPGWKIYFNDLLNRSNCGRDKLRRMLDELESCGYVKSGQKQDPNTCQFLPKTYSVYFEPLTENPSTEKPLTGKPSTGEPFTENPPLSNKKDTNKKKKNNQLNNEQYVSRENDPIDYFSLDSEDEDKTNTLSISNVSDFEKVDLAPGDCGKVEKKEFDVLGFLGGLESFVNGDIELDQVHEDPTKGVLKVEKRKLPRGGHDPEGFAKFWAQYPRKTAKDKAQSAWNRLKPDVGLQDTILHDLAQRKQNDHQWREVAFTPHAATYLNGQRWQDEIIKPNLQNVPVRQGKQNQSDDTSDLWAIMRGEAV